MGGAVMRTDKTDVRAAVAKFLVSLRERNVSPHTIKAYTGDLANFSAYIGSRKWREIDHVTIRGFLSQLYHKGLSKTSVARSLAAVRSLYRWLAVEGVVEQNPAALVSTPKLPKKLPRVPTMEEKGTLRSIWCRGYVCVVGLSADSADGAVGIAKRYAGFANQPTRRAADYAQCWTHYQEDRGRQRIVAGCASAHSASCVRDPHARRRRRPAGYPGDARP